MLIMVIALFVNVVMCYIGCKLYIKFATKYNITDAPNERTNHYGIIPRGLGVVIIPISLLCSMVFLKLKYSDISGNIYWYLIITILCCIIFFLEDIGDINVITRFIIQILFIGIGIYLLRDNITSVMPKLPYSLKIVIITFGWLWFVNLYNFMDGIDGITFIETISIGFGMIGIVCLGSLLYNEGTIAETLFHNKHETFSSDSLDFYKWPIIFLVSGMMIFGIFNYGKAEAFIGDSGSTALGLFMGGMLIKFGDEYTILGAMTLPLYYIMDATITILIRLYNKEKIWLPHTKHFFQLAKRNGHSNHAICKKIIILNITLIILTILQVSSRGNTIAGIMLLAIGLVITFMLLWNFKKNIL